MTHCTLSRLFLVFLTVVLCFPLKAQNYEHMSEIEQEHYGDFAMVNGDYQTMKNVRHYWVQQAQRLKFLKAVEFNLTGSNESILKVTIPARMLFSQNAVAFSRCLPSSFVALREGLRCCCHDDYRCLQRQQWQREVSAANLWKSCSSGLSMVCPTGRRSLRDALLRMGQQGAAQRECQHPAARKESSHHHLFRPQPQNAPLG